MFVHTDQSRRKGAALLILCAGGFFAGCLGPVPRRGKPLPEAPPPAPEAPPTSGRMEVPVAPLPKGQVAAIWAPGPNVDALGSAQYLAQRPWIRLTALFPEHFFGDDEKSRRAKALFQTLVSSKQVEVVLTLPDQPVLPLVMDTANARASTPTVAALPPAFSWPEDAVEQMGLAREAYRRRWRTPPTGLKLPWGVALGPEFPLIAKFKIEWALFPATGPVPAWIEGFKVPGIRPGLLPSGAARKEWMVSQAQSVLLASGTVGPVQVGAVEELGVFEGMVRSTGTLGWVFLSEAVKGGLPGVPRQKPPPVDFTPWIGDEEENRAWELLGVARRSVSDYQDSGSANLHSLDLAKRTLYGAENGAFFEQFGAEKDTGRGDDVLRDFTATLSQVYRILGEPEPPEIHRGFSGKTEGVPGGDDTGGIFLREGTSLRWRDARNDDRGPGDYFYPTGSQFPPGSWDLWGFDVRPTGEDLTFVFHFAALANPGRAPSGFSLPLVDLYIDINRSAGAGSQEFLPGRPGMAEAADAWEYALSADGWGARFYSFVPGRGPRLQGTFSVVKSTDAAFSVTVPRRYFRGDPESWGYAVAVMGRSSGGASPMPVDVEPGPDRFGGAMPGKAAPPYIDLLVPAGRSQRWILGGYKNGQDITLPFVRAD